MNRVHGEVTEAIKRALRSGDATSHGLAEALQLPRSTVTVVVSRLHAVGSVHVSDYTTHVKARGQTYLRAVYRWGPGDDEPPPETYRLIPQRAADDPAAAAGSAEPPPTYPRVASVFDWAQTVGGTTE